MTIYTENFSPAEELLILALKEERTDSERYSIHSLYRQLGDDVVYKAAVINKVVPIVAHGLMDSVPTTELGKHWKIAHDEVEKKLNAFFLALDNLSIICEAESIRIVAIENGGIARGVQKCRGCFASSDLEILVDHGQLKTFERLLTGNGFTHRSRERCASEKSSQWDRDIRGWDNYCKQLSDGYEFWLNVQWRPVLRRWVPMERGLEPGDLIARSIPIKESFSRVRILSPEDNLLVCALHVASHSYVRGIGLRLQLDIDRLVRNVYIDWDLFLELARRYDADILVFPSLAVPSAIFGTPIPEHVFHALVPSVRKRSHILKLIARAGIMNRSDHKFTPWDLVQLELSLTKGGRMAGLRRILFPPADWIREGYRLNSGQPVLGANFDRLFDLGRRRHA